MTLKKLQTLQLSTLLLILFGVVSCSNESANKPEGKSIKVSDVELATQPLAEFDSETAIKKLLQTQIESYGANHETLILGERSGLVFAAHTAFRDHRPLVLSPDMIWYTICHGVAQHISNNPEKLRDKLVKFDGKKVLKVRRDNFVKGSSSNDWPSVFPEFVKQIEENSHSSLPQFINTDFTTTGPMERLSRQVCTMDAYKSFFGYECYTMCGIPEIILEGTTEDWQLMLDKIDLLQEFELGWWIKSLKPILIKFVESSRGNIDRDFWKSFYKFESESGYEVVTGWIVMMYPYLHSTASEAPQNHYAKMSLQELYKAIKETSSKRVDALDPPEGLSYSSFPNSYVRVPFKWVFFHTSYDMYFYAGVMGLSQNKETMAIRPEFGWAVGEKHLNHRKPMI